MKTSSFLSTLLLTVASTSHAFSPALFHPCQRSNSVVVLNAVNGEISASSPELEEAIAEVRAAASEFGDETAHFANTWIDKMLEGKQEGMASGLLEECVVDDNSENCVRFETALKKLDSLLGVGATEQY